MSKAEPVRAPSSTSVQVEEWLRQVVQRGDRSIEQVACAMAEDGFPAHQARLFAALAQLRFSHLPVLELLEHQPMREALASLREHLGDALDEYHGQLVVQPNEPLLDPRALVANEVACGEGTASLALVCHHPRIAQFQGALTDSECDSLIALARPRMRASETINYATGVRSVESHRRSSRTAFFKVDEAALSRTVAERAAQLIGWPVSHCEDVVITHYLPGAEFVAHVDYFEGLGTTQLGEDGQRVATVIFYLNRVEAGGATAFPALGLEVRPQRGSALYFGYRMADGSLDPASVHAGLPVVVGEKWIATLWFHERPSSTLELPRFGGHPKARNTARRE
jgi:prolyl 4-hydroxylase